MALSLVQPGQIPSIQARVDIRERWRTNSRWGDLTFPTLANVLARGATGDVADLADLCEYAIGSDDHLSSLYDTRISRVMQADWIIVPGKFGNPQVAKLAAEFVDQQLLRIENWHQAMRDALHAIAVGYSCGEMLWDYDSVNRTNYVQSITHRHGHRFRYDEEWNLRLYDFGTKHGDGSRYGEALDPRLWLIHQHRIQAGYPSIGGVMRSCLARWLFRRWNDKWWLGYLERHGGPTTYAKVPMNTPEDTRQRILTQLEQLSAEHVGVIEDGGEIKVEAAAAAASSWQSYQEYQGYNDNCMTRDWLGASDLVEPGKVGSQAAVSTRAGLTIDPRMVTDGANLSASLSATLFKQLIRLNAHKFGVPVEQVPIPEMRLRTADDEVKTDNTDLQQENALVPGAPKAPKPAAPQLNALNGSEIEAVSGVLKQAKALPRATVVELLRLAAPTLSQEKAEVLASSVTS